MLQQTIRRLLLTALAACAIVLPALGQETTAGIQGTIKDPAGGVVVKATVEVAGSALLGARKVQTDDAGSYRITALPPGDYTLTVTAPGFRTSKIAGIALTVGRLPNIDVELQVGAVAESVEVSATSPPEYSQGALLPVRHSVCSWSSPGTSSKCSG
jgi:hypothetical protein